MYFCASKTNIITSFTRMNYEEMLAARNEGKKQKTPQPIGGYYREQVDGKWRGVVDIREDMTSNIAFCKGLEQECERNATLGGAHQLHFTPVRQGSDISQLELETGHFQSYEQLLIENPAIVVEKGFLEQTLAGLVEATTYLHQQGIKHVCFSPRTVFARKGDRAVMLLSHGEFYLGVSDQREFYGKDVAFVAPEVLEHGSIDERCDVYSIGKFIESLCQQSDLPMEFRPSVRRAVSESPEDRFQTPDDMLRAIRKRRDTVKSLVSFAVAVVIAAMCIGLYFDMMPESNPVEFVKPAPRQATDDLIDDGFDPAELGVTSDGDSLVVDEATERDYQAKAEEIFRKKYEKEANRILSKIYNKSYMSMGEKQYLTESESTLKELMEAQSALAGQSGLTEERAQVIATEVIDHVTNQKKQELGTAKQNGIQK